MADSLALSIAASLGWSFDDTLDLSTVRDNSSVAYDESLADGTGNNQTDKIWHDRRTIAGEADDDLDLAGGLTNTIYGASVGITFVKIKAILIVNLNTVSGDNLVLDSSVSASILTLFGGVATSMIPIPANSPLLMVNKIAGWAVTATTADILRITNLSANSVQYDIVIAGTSA